MKAALLFLGVMLSASACAYVSVVHKDGSAVVFGIISFVHLSLLVGEVTRGW